MEYPVCEYVTDFKYFILTGWSTDLVYLNGGLNRPPGQNDFLYLVSTATHYVLPSSLVSSLFDLLDLGSAEW